MLLLWSMCFDYRVAVGKVLWSYLPLYMGGELRYHNVLMDNMRCVRKMWWYNESFIL